MSALHAFLAMGGYALYVWPAYAVFFIVLIADTVAPSLRRRRVLRDLRVRMARQVSRQERSRADHPDDNPTFTSASP
ncbi:heme exporter protein CcmD [Rhodanobacter ginsengisoli]|uniref:Heme exporter protein D n=1 Tax=Rhodanobacter ginsengisoli TaxID=418646 RepID=A0ABW0QRD2_9GAMM